MNLYLLEASELEMICGIWCPIAWVHELKIGHTEHKWPGALWKQNVNDINSEENFTL